MIPIGILLVAFLFGLFQPQFFPSTSRLQSCYHATVGDSSSLLQIKDPNAEQLTGELIFQNYEKDSSYGLFTANLAADQLTLDFTFQSEGVESKRQITLTKSGDELSGEGYLYKPVDDCKKVLYNQGLGLIPFDMKLPLYLFPQMKLQAVSEEQLGWTFGPGGFKPIQSAKIVYTPTTGDSVNAVVFYLWQKSVWDVIANPNEAPDWGVMQPKYAPAQVKVVKTTTFQDPETGFYVLSQFNILGIKSDQSYRCDLTAFDKTGKEIISWKTDGLSFSPRPSTIYSGQTNITPDQVPTVSSSSVKCEVADAII